jgi:hypothetical protein
LLLGQRCFYSKDSLDFKLTAVARNRGGEGCRSIGRLLEIDPSLITRWDQQEDLLKATVDQRGVNKNLRHRMHPGRASTINKEVEKQLMAWIDHERYNRFSKMTVRKIIRKVRELDAMLTPVNNKLLRRHLWQVFHQKRISTRAITHQAQVPRDCLVVIDNWAEYIQEMLALHSKICNFDQTNVYYSPKDKSMLSRRGERTVIISKTESPCRYTVMLGVAGDGHRIPPISSFVVSLMVGLIDANWQLSMRVMRKGRWQTTPTTTTLYPASMLYYPKHGWTAG